MDDVRKTIVRAIEAKGMTYKEVSLAIGKNPAYIQQFIERNVPARLKEQERYKISQVLGIDEIELGAPGRGRRSRSGDVGELDIHAGMGNGGLLHVESDGMGQVRDEFISGYWSFPDHVKASMRNLGAVYAVPVVGDSMEPTIAGGSIVFVDTKHTFPAPQDIYAVDYGHGLMVKRLELVPQSETVRIISDNKHYDTYELDVQSIAVYGRVVAWFQWRG